MDNNNEPVCFFIIHPRKKKYFFISFNVLRKITNENVPNSV